MRDLVGDLTKDSVGALIADMSSSVCTGACAVTLSGTVLVARFVGPPLVPDPFDFEVDVLVGDGVGPNAASSAAVDLAGLRGVEEAGFDTGSETSASPVS